MSKAKAPPKPSKRMRSAIAAAANTEKALKTLAARRPAEPAGLNYRQSLALRHERDDAMKAAQDALLLLTNMLEAGAIRLPFIGFEAVVANLKKAVG